ncbi:5-carboxymethyl-2-hydroxymuconate Delta-isomerase [Noviherbaspirillum massiliense]|uniref:5-carboxymethyl-2-hydroxymuconate Delta-isomerase n=1 Tax=Noviherbaspirillum massiliense TaxID=1465823 RepID=UPI00030CC84C|nr:5-carboxymethyl-2-hydroxymuconate Delta-isomerase [Noviherbaspirillum massiliense]
MPHLTIEYSPGVLQETDLESTLRNVNASLLASGAIQRESDLKSRIVLRDVIRIGTGEGSRGFVYAQLRILPGRTPQVRSDLSARIAAVLREHCQRPPGMTVQLSVEIAEMEKESYIKEVL